MKRPTKSAPLLAAVCWTALLTAGSAALCCWLLPETVEIDAARFFPGTVLRPEPAEQGTYVVTTLLLPVLALLGILLGTRGRGRHPERVAGGCALGLGVLGFVMLFHHQEFLEFTLQQLLAAPWSWPAAAGLGALTALALRFVPPTRGRWWWLGLGWGLALLALLTTRLYPVELLHVLYTHHFEPVAYAVAQTVAGRCDAHMYGFYPQFLAPVFLLFGLSVRTLSLIFGLLFLLTFGLLIWSVHRAVRRKLLTLVFALGLCFFGAWWSIYSMFGFDPYYQYHPIRSLFPALAGAYLFLPWRDRNAFYCGAGALSALALIWNLESGVAVAGGFLFLLLLELFARRGRGLGPAIGRFVLTGGGLLGLWYVLHSLRCGAWYNPAALLRVPRLFVEQGLNLLPLPPLPAAWGAVLLLYLAGVTTGLYLAWKQPRAICCGALRFPVLWSIMGLGLFSSYLGRSHEANLASAGYPALILAIWFLDRSLHDGRHRRPRWLWLGLFFPFFLLFGFTLLGLGIRTPVILRRATTLPAGYFTHRVGPFHADAEFVRQCAGGRAINLWCRNQGLLYAETGLAAADSDLCQSEVVLPEDQERVWRELRASTAPLIVGPVQEQGQPVPAELLETCYRLIAVSPDGRYRYYEPTAALEAAQPGE